MRIYSEQFSSEFKMYGHYSGYDEIVQLLLDNGAEINSSIVVDTTIGLNIDNKTIYSVPIHLDRTTAIHFAAYAGFLNIFHSIFFLFFLI